MIFAEKIDFNPITFEKKNIKLINFVKIKPVFFLLVVAIKKVKKKNYINASKFHNFTANIYGCHKILFRLCVFLTLFSRRKTKLIFFFV